jgi:MarR family transcriptional regulator, organic hydroperoxide resistance regulator
MNKKQAPIPEASPDVPDGPWNNPRFRNWIAVVRAHALCKKAMTTGLAPLGLKLANYDMLVNVYRHPGLTQLELSEKLLVGRSNMTMLLPDMVKRGLIRRESDHGDRRIRRLYLTPEGEALAKAGIAVQNDILKRMFNVLSPTECEAVGEMMRRVSKALAEG